VSHQDALIKCNNHTLEPITCPRNTWTQWGQTTMEAWPGTFFHCVAVHKGSGSENRYLGPVHQMSVSCSQRTCLYLPTQHKN